MNFEQLTNPTLLADMELDRYIHRLKYMDYPNKEFMSEQRIWERWLV